MLTATNVVAIEAAADVDDAALLRAAVSGGLTLEPERAVRETSTPGTPRKPGKRWWTRPELTTLAIAAVLLAVSELTEYVVKFETVSAAFGIASIAIGIVYPLRNAWSMLRMKRFSFNVLLVVAVAGALALNRAGDAADLVVIFSLGAVLESYVADRARGSIRALMELTPPMAERFGTDGVVETVAVEKLHVGDTVLVRPGSRLPTDGTVLAGSSWVDASAITGESMPVEVGPGTAVFGGTLNGDAALRLAVAKPYVDTVLARVIREVEESQANKGRAQRFADRFSNIYTPAMVVLAVLVAAIGPMLGLTFTDAVYRGLVVLIVSCSCALVLSVPVSVVAAVARAARDGVLIKGGAYLEQLAGVDTVAFDKTGTLTLGRPVLVKVHAFNGRTETDILALAAGVEAGATHPIAAAIVRATRERGTTVRPLPDARTLAGIGAEATLDGHTVSVGRVRNLDGDAAATAALADIEAAGATPVGVVDDGTLIGMLGLADEIRPDAAAAIEGLRRLGVKHTTMLTGDRASVAHAIAGQLGIEAVRAELMPEDKSAAVTALREKGTVAMVGDGVNDAPALATADVAIVMGAAGTDVALETADIALMADDLTKLPYAIALARRARTNIRQNIALSLIVVGLLVTAALSGAFTLTEGVMINEGYALVIIANGLRLLRAKRHVMTVGTTTSRPPRNTATPALTEPPASIPAATDEQCGCCGTSAQQDAGPKDAGQSEHGGLVSTLPVSHAVSPTSVVSACGCATNGTDACCGEQLDDRQHVSAPTLNLVRKADGD
jgi:Cd2+/Zn2+-exporting ATPase